MEITEKWLGEIGGWQAMKAARDMVKLGQVTQARREGDIIHGLAGSGKIKFKASLTVGDSKRVEGVCSCAEARRGLICAHSLAVALQILIGSKVETLAPKKAATSSQAPVAVKASASTPATELKNVIKQPLEAVPKGDFHLYLPVDQLTRLSTGGTIPVFFQFDPSGDGNELAVANWLHGEGLPIRNQGLRLDAQQFVSLVKILEGHPRIFNGNLGAKNASKVFIQNASTLLNILKCEKNEQDVHFKLNASRYTVQKQVKLSLLVIGSDVILSSLAEWGKEILSLLEDLAVLTVVKRPLSWLAAHLNEITELAGEGALPPGLKLATASPVFNLLLDGDLRHLKAAATVEIDTQRHILCDSRANEVYPIQDKLNSDNFYGRNEYKERLAFDALLKEGFSLRSDGQFEIRDEVKILHFLTTGSRELKSLFKLEEAPQWRRAASAIAIIRPQVKSKQSAVEVGASGSGMDWLNLEVSYESLDGVRVSRAEVMRLIRSGRAWSKTQDGRRMVVDVDACEDLEETLQDASSHFDGEGRFRIKTLQADAFADFTQDAKQWANLLQLPLLPVEKLKGDLGLLGEKLRPYQLEGVQWMERLSRMQAGAVLADEMGLGKTVQTLALIRMALYARPAGDASPALVVCPTSLLSNWAEEAAKFTPELRTFISHGIDRKDNLSNLSNFDVIFTSYSLISRDIAYYKALKICLIILDEASYIRNADTEGARAVRQINAKARFALTGTPVENSVKDLWSIFQFALPSYLPRREDFHERYVKPINQPDSKPAQAAMERLRRLIKPYLLRRTKREVVKELPDKIEKIIWCDLTPLQREVYQRLLDEGREEIRQAKKRSGKGAARMTMFTVLLRLRQISNDVRLTGMKTADVKADASGGKWPVFDEMIQELVEGDHRALIFSQFVGMLHLVRDRLKDLGETFSYLDGSTQDRAGQIDAFQKRKENRFFLISLKAGGYGLNLTSADTVMLMDPWWNPAVEAQAIDRAHRIGQDRPVTACRFITRGTVEEKILKLQDQKRAVMDMAFDENAAVLSGLSDDELEAMLMG